MEDFFSSGPTLALFDVIFRHVDGYDGLPDMAALKTFILGAEQSAAAYARNYGGTVKEIRKAQRVNAAFQQVLDHPEAAELLAHPAMSRCSTRPATKPGGGPEHPMSDHISGPRALADPIADITDVYAFPSPEQADRLVLVMNTLPMAQPSDSFSGGSSTASGCARSRPTTGGRWHFVPAGEEFVLDCVFSPPGRTPRRRSGRHLHVADRRDGLVPGERPTRAVPGPVCASSPAPAGTPSSWTPVPP